MADDSHRDSLPVKDGSCVNTCRSSVTDARERHAVCKLDRYQLEDRYLRLLDEVQDLKKLSNTQEDKIKRLATKLMRVAATPRSCLSTVLDFNNDNNRVKCLEHENAKLKDKITVLRNQILNHKIGRSPSRTRRHRIYSSSGTTTFRSDIGHTKDSSSHIFHDTEDDKDGQNYLAKIEELEVHKKAMSLTIADLQTQLEDYKIGKQREKAADNVEFIRVWRQMKQQSDQLISAQALNVSLTSQISDLKRMLEEKTRSNTEIADALMAEKKKFAQLDEELVQAKTLHLSFREKDDQIKDLMNEIRILHQHNAELVALSSKYNQVEQENAELKKTISRQLTDHQTLKNAFSNEQANITALQAANEQLIGKLHDLQKNIDSLTIQLKTFQSQNERLKISKPESQIIKTVNSATNTNSLTEKLTASSDQHLENTNVTCKNCRQGSEDKPPEPKRMVDRQIQTEDIFKDITREENETPKRVITNSPMRPDRSFQSDSGGAILKPEEMLKLLDDAQINTSNDVQNSVRMRQIGSTLSKEFLNSSELNQNQRKNAVVGNVGNSVLEIRSSPNKICKAGHSVYRGYRTCNTCKDCVTSTFSIPERNFDKVDQPCERYQCDFAWDPFRNVVNDISTCIKNAFDNIQMSRIIRTDGTVGPCCRSQQSPNVTSDLIKVSSVKEIGVISHDEAPSSIKSKISCIAEETLESHTDGLRTDMSIGQTSTNSFKNGSPISVPEDITQKLPKASSVDWSRHNKAWNSEQAKSSDITQEKQEDPPVTIEQSVNDASTNNGCRRDSAIDSYLSTSLEQSDSSATRAMEYEDSTSEDVQNTGKKRQVSPERVLTKVEAVSTKRDTDEVDSDSVDEFNSLIRNNTILSHQESDSSVRDLSTVFSDERWREYKKRSMTNERKFSKSSTGTTYDRSAESSQPSANKVAGENNSITITIGSLFFNEGCPLLEDPEVNQLYVEFSFLGYDGVDMETVSVPKPSVAKEIVYFNYMKKFRIDAGDEYRMQRNIMRAMMTEDDNPTIKFVVVSEPLPSEMETKECVELGYAYLNIRNHVLGKNSSRVQLTIVDVDHTKGIGTLNITLLGADAIRRCMSDAS